MSTYFHTMVARRRLNTFLKSGNIHQDIKIPRLIVKVKDFYKIFTRILEISLENCFKSIINHDYDIGNIQTPYISNIIVAVYLTVIKLKMNKSKDSKLLTNAELEYRIKTNKNSNPKMLLDDIGELSKRREIKEQEYKQTNQENKKTQGKITIMTFIIMILTIIILGFTVAQFFKTPNHKQPMENSIKP